MFQSHWVEPTQRLHAASLLTSSHIEDWTRSWTQYNPSHQPMWEQIQTKFGLCANTAGQFLRSFKQSANRRVILIPGSFIAYRDLSVGETINPDRQVGSKKAASTIRMSIYMGAVGFSRWLLSQLT